MKLIPSIAKAVKEFERINGVKPKWLVIDRETFEELRSIRDEYFSRYSSFTSVDKFMGLNIAIAETNVTVMEVL
jgi:hypothetical protein